MLGAAGGKSSYVLSDELGLSRPTIQRWLDRYEDDGLEGLEDRPRSGRPRTVTLDVEAEVIRKTLEEKPPEGTHWSSRLLGNIMGLHHSQVSRIWAVKSRVVCKSERKLLDASVRLPWRPPSVREA